MKKNIFPLLILVAFTLPVFAQQKAMSEEAAIKKVIENETMYFKQRNFDKWAECVAHDPMTYYTWTTPFAGENSVFEARGWEEVSTAFKGFMEKWPADDSPSNKDRYHFKINGNMAYVTFLEDNRTESVRVLEKKDGQWRILRMEALASKAFEKMHQLYALQRMAGSWEVDMSTFKKEGGGNWKMMSGTIDIQRTPTGIQTSEKFSYLNKEGEYRSTEEMTIASLNMKTGKIGILNSVHFPNFNWSEAYSATGSFDKDGVMNCVGQEVGGDDYADLKMQLKDGQLHWSVNVKDKDGKEVYASSYSMHRAGSDAIKP